MAQKHLYIQTYGCAMNVYDSERMADTIRPMGYQSTENPAEADIIILNTCHIREKATEKLYSQLGRFHKEEKKRGAKGKNPLIIVAGCVAQAEGEEIFRRAPYVSIVVGPQSYQTLPDLIGQAQREAGHKKKHFINLEFYNDKFDTLHDADQATGPASILSIQEGCDKFCTFCVVPYTRGAEYSRPVAPLYRESMALASKGAKEITLLGQNVNAFHGIAPGEAEGSEKTWNLGQLIRHIGTLEGVERIRYSTSHPRDMHEELYRAHAEEEKLMPFLNLPVQSGSDRILKAMNRKHTRDEYFRIIERLRQERPGMEFSSDFIIGFPGETEQDFQDTLDLAKEVNFIQAYSFTYSPRPGTPGADMENQVPEEIKKERLRIFQEAIKSQQLPFNRSCVGKTIPVLFDQPVKENGQIVGRSEYMQSVVIQGAAGADLYGKIVDVSVTSASQNSLQGELLLSQAA